MACNLSFKSEGVLKAIGGHIHFKRGTILEAVLDRNVATTGHQQK